MTSRRDALETVKAGPSFHPGLWLDAFLYTADRKETDRLREHLAQVTGTIRVPKGYGAAYRRRLAALQSLQSGEEATLTHRGKVTGRLAAGLGIASVLENGLRLDRTWGLPCIPGSSLKGVARGFAARSGGEAWGPDSPAFEELFGSTDLSGLVTFHDAWWIPEDSDSLPFSVDVLTPHHQGWNGKLGGDPGKVAPLDSDSPIPVTFLTATGCYLIALTGPRGWVEQAAEILQRALEVEGVGSKTSAGYGRLTLEPILSPEQQEAFDRGARAALRQERALRSVRAHRKGNASAIGAVIDDLMTLSGDPGAQDAVREAGAALWAKDKDTVKKWAKKDNRTPEEQDFVDRFLRPSAAPPERSSREVAAQPTGAAPPEGVWTAGTAKIKKRGKKIRLFAEAPDVQLRDTSPQNVTFEGEGLRLKMDQSQGRDFEVEVFHQDGKIKKIRLR